VKWAEVLGIAAVLAGMTLLEWPKMEKRMKREKTAFAVLTVSGGILAVLLLFNPDMPGPTQGLEALFGPLVSFLE
jgi:hypothetical protein